MAHELGAAMNGRRRVLTLIGTAPWLIKPARGARPGVIGALAPFPGTPPDAGLRSWLRQMGDPEAETQKIVTLSSEGHDELLPKLASELVALQPSVILTWGDPGARAAQAATKRIPIVVMTEDLLAAGHVDNMSRPGGNMTGVSVMSTELDAKRLELLASLLPQHGKVLVLFDGVTSPVSRPAMRRTAQTLGIRLEEVEARTPGEIQVALEGARSRGIDGVNIVASSSFHSQMDRIIGWANAARIPAIVQWGFFVDDGALISYGPQLNPLYVRLLSKVLGLMRGGKIADFPVELPTIFELAVNLKTAKIIGIEIPRALVQRADRVVE